MKLEASTKGRNAILCS